MGWRRAVGALVAAVAGLLPLWLALGAGAAARTETVHLRVGGLERSYRLVVPAHHRAHPPLLLALHYLNGNAAGFARVSHLAAGADRAGVVLAYPDGVGRSWDAGTCCGVAAARQLDDVAFLVAVVRDVERRAHVDPRRVAVTGFSNGALMAYRLVCARPDVVHVAAVAAGDVVAPGCAPARPVSMLHVHGIQDRVIPFPGEPISPIDRSGFPPAVQSIERIAAADRCDGLASSRAGNTTVLTGTHCAAGAQVQLVAVDGLGHLWWSQMTARVWRFVTTAWSSGDAAA